MALYDNYLNGGAFQSPEGTPPQGPTAGMIGVQQGAGNVGFAMPGGANSTSSPTGGFNTGSNPGWDANQKDPMGGYGTNSSPWQNTALTGAPQAWQSFQFKDPTEDWQKNFNSIQDPVARMMYGFGQAKGGEGLLNYMSQGGLDNQAINNLRQGFGSRGSDATQALQTLGVNQGDIGFRQMQQQGNQLWSVDPLTRQKQLVQDFGNSANVTDARPQDQKGMWTAQNSPWMAAHSGPQSFGGGININQMNIDPSTGLPRQQSNWALPTAPTAPTAKYTPGAIARQYGGGYGNNSRNRMGIRSY